MSAAAMYPHLTLDDQGHMRISGSRYKVAHLAAEHYQYGWSAEELLRQHPDLKPGEVYAALAFFYDHYDAVVERIKQDFGEAQRTRTPPPVSREELLKRRATPG
jgi:uncharacterized protein (DUF433 family)